jgi:hypothetical protein
MPPAHHRRSGGALRPGRRWVRKRRAGEPQRQRDWDRLKKRVAVEERIEQVDHALGIDGGRVLTQRRPKVRPQLGWDTCYRLPCADHVLTRAQNAASHAI